VTPEGTQFPDPEEEEARRAERPRGDAETPVDAVPDAENEVADERVEIVKRPDPG